MKTYKDSRTSSYKNHRTSKQEFKILTQGEKEGIREFSRRVGLLAEISNATWNAVIRDNMNREMINYWLFDMEIKELLLREQPNTFNDSVDMALNIYFISQGSRLRQRRRCNHKEILKSIAIWGETSCSSCKWRLGDWQNEDGHWWDEKTMEE